jgi:nucleotide-binding universal stress UspA family protein
VNQPKRERDMKGYRKILIAMNGSREVLREGLKLAGDERCWVTVVKVIPPYDGDLDLTSIKNIGDVLNSNMRRDAAVIKEIAVAERALVKARIEQGEVHEKIVEVAEDENCDLIIMGRNTTNWFRKLFGKNVIEKVISTAPCPVLVVGT